MVREQQMRQLASAKAALEKEMASVRARSSGGGAAETIQRMARARGGARAQAAGGGGGRREGRRRRGTRGAAALTRLRRRRRAADRALEAQAAGLGARAAEASQKLVESQARTRVMELVCG